MPSSSTIAAVNVLNLVAYIANIGLVNGVPCLFHLPDNAELSAKYQTIVTPAGWAFAIWGLIFLMQAIWSVVQLVLPQIRTHPLVVQGVGYNYIVVCAVQVGWTFSFALEQMTLSMVWMLAILFYLIRIYREQNKVLMEDNDLSNKNYWLLQFPFNLHLGWIVAATLVNFNVVLVAYGASTPLLFTSAISSLTIALVVAATVLYQQKDKSHPDVVIPLVLVWALNAISKELKHPKDLIINTFTVQEIDLVKNGAMLGAIAILNATFGVVAIAVWKNRAGGEYVRLRDEQS